MNTVVEISENTNLVNSRVIEMKTPYRQESQLFKLFTCIALLSVSSIFAYYFNAFNTSKIKSKNFLISDLNLDLNKYNYSKDNLGKPPIFMLQNHTNIKSINEPISQIKTIPNPIENYNSTAINFSNKSNKKSNTKKKILLEFGVSGLGNRLIAISSAAFMSILLDRVLEISWEKNIGCEASYLKLFDPLPEHNKFQPFLQDEVHVKIAGGSKRKLNKCYMHLDGVEDPQHGYIRYEQFHLVNNPNLLKKLDNDCDIINIKANIYFTHLLLNNHHGIYASEIKSHFNRPFYSISNVVFKPQKFILKKIDEIKKLIYRENKNTKWLSIQVRGLFSNAGSSPYEYLKCANELLDKGLIDYVFFATDSLPIQEKAYHIINNKKAFLSINKTLIKNDKQDNIEIRETLSEMEAAVADWYLVGEADYCMSPSVDESTFSKTAIARGKCIFIDIHQANYCNKVSQIKTTNSHIDKEFLLYHERGLHGYEGPWLKLPDIPGDLESHVWKSVIQNHKLEALEQVVTSDTPANVIFDYWNKGNM